jgi:hypothetical protein
MSLVWHNRRATSGSESLTIHCRGRWSYIAVAADHTSLWLLTMYCCCCRPYTAHAVCSAGGAALPDPEDIAESDLDLSLEQLERYDTQPVALAS